MDKEQINISYCKFVENRLPKTKFFPSLLWAFLVGGLICCIGQGINDGLSAIFPALNKDDIQAYTLIILIFLASFLTGIGVYDRIGAFAGAGTLASPPRIQPCAREGASALWVEAAGIRPVGYGVYRPALHGDRQKVLG